MKRFTYTITDPFGLHARPAGALLQAVKGLDSVVTLTKGDGSRSACAAHMMNVLCLGIRTGETVTVTIEGGQEEQSLAVLERFFRENL